MTGPGKIEASVFQVPLSLPLLPAHAHPPWPHQGPLTPMVQQVKNLPEIQEIQVQSLDQEDPLGEEMATSSNSLA